MELAESLAVLNREIAMLRMVVARRFDLTVQQGELLCQINRDSPSFGELALRLGCDKTNITGMIDRLAQRGLVSRRPDPTDRRVTRAVLTADGIELGARIRAAFSAEVERRCADLSPEDCSQLIRLTRSIADDLAGSKTP
ncbi:MarR family winged helix-turn-helix transcriptional regulator [Nocardia aobensis]|uniref:MarR family winged helix-turn-helix transcriptional regulator n=1 Tax=Nocardia aobensis TaxID=257277 RepID=UPI0002FA27C2|nr:MarR family transcriptional regulator [Nocardia aobensis]